MRQHGRRAKARRALVERVIAENTLEAQRIMYVHSVMFRHGGVERRRGFRYIRTLQDAD